VRKMIILNILSILLLATFIIVAIAIYVDLVKEWRRWNKDHIQDGT